MYRKGYNMKYCLSSRVEMNTLKKADEIKVQFRDRKAIPDFFDKYPQADIILYCGVGDEIDWEEIKNFDILGQGRFIIAFAKTDDLLKARDLGYKYFYGFPITSLYELNAVKDLGVAYAKIGIPLFFNMDEVQAVGVPVRVVPNVAYDDGFPRASGVYGKWIRPEDLDPLYGDYVDAIEFEGVDPEKEALLYRIYAEDKEWRRSLDLIIVNFNHSGNNRVILSSELERRTNCGHRCQRGKCSICERVMNLADVEMLREYKEQVLDPKKEETE